MTRKKWWQLDSRGQQPLKVLVVGGGGREHALVHRLVQENGRMWESRTITVAPGNPGIAGLAECVPVDADDIRTLAQLAAERRVDFTLVGPEAPLAAGIVDRFRDEGLPIFGPTRDAAQIETSKAFAKDLMHGASVPTARALICTEAAKAKGGARELGLPVVIKASGLAAGKGVVVCETIEDADRAIDDMLTRKSFGVAGQEILVEEFLSGEELSVLGITDGESVLPLVAAQDHKRLLEGDRGPNTGGMGAYAPVSLATDVLMREIVDRIFKPTLAALAARGMPFTGVLYAGLMLTPDGPRVVEFNCRFGDPETQSVLAVSKLNQDFPELLFALARGEKLPADATCVAHQCAVTTVLAAEGYPGRPRKGVPIDVPNPRAYRGAVVYHAGTALDERGRLIVAGGRVLSVTGFARKLEDAQRHSLDLARRIEFEGKQFRSDIGWRELARGAVSAGAS